MDCGNHSGVAAVDRCVGCAEGFCENCLVEVKGQRYCGQCKYMTVKGPPHIEEAKEGTTPCKEANNALICAVVGFVFFPLGLVLQPIAIAKALKAKKMIREYPELTGSGKARAALIIGTVYLIPIALSFLRTIAVLY